jgi:hypothetical protein
LDTDSRRLRAVPAPQDAIDFIEYFLCAHIEQLEGDPFPQPGSVFQGRNARRPE